MLFIGGQHDTPHSEHMRRIATHVQNGTALICPNGSHMSLCDDDLRGYYVGRLTKYSGREPGGAIGKL